MEAFPVAEDWTLGECMQRLLKKGMTVAVALTGSLSLFSAGPVRADLALAPSCAAVPLATEIDRAAAAASTAAAAVCPASVEPLDTPVRAVQGIGRVVETPLLYCRKQDSSQKGFDCKNLKRTAGQRDEACMGRVEWVRSRTHDPGTTPALFPNRGS